MIPSPPNQPLTRRNFLGGALMAATAASSLRSLTSLAADSPAPAAPPVEFKRKIKIGLVGCGGRGSWIGQLFKKHGGYEMHAVADYFPSVSDQCGEALGVDKSRRFSTLSAYKRLIESGVEAVALEAIPYFLPIHAKAAVEAGLHVYMAKPVATDVPGSMQVLAAGLDAAKKQKTFWVDYQMPTDPGNQETLKRIRAEGFGKISQINTVGICNGFSDPPRTENLESRMRSLIWVNDAALGADYIGNFDIHAIDAALWALERRPVTALGSSQIARPDPHGDSRDVCSVIYEYADGLVHNHYGQGLNNFCPGELSCHIHGQKGHAILNYWAKTQMRSFDDAYSANVDNLYEAGALRNIAAFYQKVTEGQSGGNVQRAVDGVLTCLLGREAGLRHGRLTMDEFIRANKRAEVDLKGLKT